MVHELFSMHFPKIAERETSGIKVLPDNDDGLPIGHYFFMENYCTDQDCDCRNVYVTVFDGLTGKVHATIGYGWESYEFYKKWMREDNEDVINMFKGPALPLYGQQSPYAEHWLKIFKDIVEGDPVYQQRLISHYQIMKKAVAEGKIKGLE